MTSASRSVVNAERNSTRKRTLIGVVGHIFTNIVEKCGGAVVKRGKISLVASITSMKVRKTMMKRTRLR